MQNYNCKNHDNLKLVLLYFSLLGYNNPARLFQNALQTANPLAFGILLLLLFLAQPSQF